MFSKFRLMLQNLIPAFRHILQRLWLRLKSRLHAFIIYFLSDKTASCVERRADEYSGLLTSTDNLPRYDTLSNHRASIDTDKTKSQENLSSRLMDVVIKPLCKPAYTGTQCNVVNSHLNYTGPPTQTAPSPPYQSTPPISIFHKPAVKEALALSYWKWSRSLRRGSSWWQCLVCPDCRAILSNLMHKKQHIVCVDCGLILARGQPLTVPGWRFLRDEYFVHRGVPRICLGSEYKEEVEDVDEDGGWDTDEEGDVEGYGGWKFWRY